MTGTGSRRGALAVAAALLMVTVSLAPAAQALDVSPKAIKVVASDEYQDSNVESYAGELADVTKLDGRGGAIAILDTGVDDEHPTLQNAFIAGARYDGSCDCMREKDPVSGEKINPDDADGHGTHLASIALGRGGSGVGPRGVAPGAALVDVQLSPTLGFSPASVARGIDWVMDFNEGNTNWTGYENTPVRTIVLSLAETEPHEDRNYQDTMMKKVREATRAGILVVAAAGNCGPGSGDVSQGCSSGGAERDRIPSPGATPEALTVGAVDDNGTVLRNQDQVAGYSSRGPNPAANASDERWRKPDVVAPGTNVTAACHASTGDADRMDCSKTGTSMAAPHVAGLASIVWQAIEQAGDGDATPAEVKRLITRSAQDIGASGWDPAAGYGYVDGYGAVVEATNEPPDSRFTVRPADPKAGQQVTFDAQNSTDPDERDRIERYEWTIDGETETLPGDQPRLHRVFNETGSHTIELAAVDARGAKDPEPFVRTVHVAEPEAEETEDEGQPPTVDLAHGPSAARTGEEVWFDANNSTDPDGDELVAFAWDFTPGETFEADRTTEQPRTTWSFGEAGEHEVTVEVTDENRASARQTVTVDVREPEPEPPTVEITNPQEGDVVEPGTVNVTWIAKQGPVDAFGVSVDQAAVDETENGFLEVRLGEDDETIAVKANGPGGQDVDQVNVTVVEGESLDRSSADGRGEDQPRSNPPKPTATDNRTTDENRTTNGDARPSSTTDAEDGNETPLPLGLVVTASLLAAVGRAPRT